MTYITKYIKTMFKNVRAGSSLKDLLLITVSSPMTPLSSLMRALSGRDGGLLMLDLGGTFGLILFLLMTGGVYSPSFGESPVEGVFPRILCLCNMC